jgi:hypothetical protein
MSTEETVYMLQTLIERLAELEKIDELKENIKLVRHYAKELRDILRKDVSVFRLQYDKETKCLKVLGALSEHVYKEICGEDIEEKTLGEIVKGLEGKEFAKEALYELIESTLTLVETISTAIRVIEQQTKKS